MSLVKKAAYTSSLFAAFFCFYFAIQLTVKVNGVDLLLEIDSLIPLIPEFIWLYWSLPIQIFFVMVYMIRDKELFFQTFWSCLFSSLIMFVFYLVLPSFYPRSSIEISTISASMLELTRSFDGSHNTFPSGHVIFTWLMYIAAAKSRFVKQSNYFNFVFLFWTVGITLSTLIVKQHFIVDVIFGCILAFAVFHLVTRFTEHCRPSVLFKSMGQGGAQLD